MKDWFFRVGRLWCNYHRRKIILQCVAMACLVFFAGLPKAHAQRGAITLPHNLSDLSSTADRIVQGRVVTARVEPHPEYKSLKTLLITLQVDDVLKGETAKTLTFRQFIWDLRDISDAAGYRVGDEVLLFLNRPTTIDLTSPVGLEQGRFRIMKTRSGESLAINGDGNSHLMSGLIESGTLNASKLSARSRSTMQSFRQGPVDLDALKESVRVLLQSSARAK